MMLFNKWDVENIEVKEDALRPYIGLRKQILARTAGRRSRDHRIWVEKKHIIERLMNKLMTPGHKGKHHFLSSGHASGKSLTNYKIVLSTLNEIERRLNLNPIQVFVTAVENAAPREGITTIEYGGARYPKAVDLAPQKRIDLTLKLMVQSAYVASFNKKKTMHEALTDEIINAYKIDQSSGSISKKLELERQADGSR